jgi:MSHA biogenesis protein MshN
MSLLNDMLRDLSQDKAQDKTQHNEQSAELSAKLLNADADARMTDAAAQQLQRELFLHTSAAKPLPRTFWPSVIAFVVVLILVLAIKYLFSEPVAPLVIEEPPLVAATESALAPDDSTKSLVIAAPELDERLAALENAVTTLSNLVVNTRQQTEQTPSVAEANDELEVESAVESAFESVVESTTLELEPVERAESVSIREAFWGEEDLVGSDTINNTNDTITQDSSLFIAPNPASEDQQFAAQARRLFQAGNVDQSIAQLQTFVANHKKPYESTKLLLDILCAQENSSAVQQLLANSPVLPRVDLAYYRAKLALMAGNDAEAINILEESLSSAEQHEAYRALLAGLYQRAGMNQEAASHYWRLLNSFGEKPAYWLGFALAQDALNQPQQAIQAYQRVSQFSDLQLPVREYVEQRLLALQQ